MVRDVNADLPTFQKMIDSLPSPLNKTTTVDKCGTAFAKGIEKRKRRIYCPGWVGVLRVAKPILSSPLGESTIAKQAPTLIPELDADVAALGRSLPQRYSGADDRH